MVCGIPFWLSHRLIDAPKWVDILCLEDLRFHLLTSWSTCSEMAVAVVSSLPCLSGVMRQTNCSADGFDRLASTRCCRSTKIACGERQQKLPANRLFRGPCDSGDVRVFVLSDLHTDYKENMEWMRRLSTVWYKKDVLIVAGDVAETYKNFVFTMAELKQRFDSVFYVPGNHDLWCRREGGKFVRFSWFYAW